MWKQSFSWINIRKNSRFQKCREYERNRAAMWNAIQNSLPTTLLKKSLKHVQFIGRDGRYYVCKCQDAALSPIEYHSMVLDSTDQSKFGLPWFPTRVKNQRCHGLSVGLIGIFRHAPVNKLRLFTRTDEHATVSNHIIESIHRIVNEVADDGSLPGIFYLQLNNCWR